jgi:hypothetical protein
MLKFRYNDTNYDIIGNFGFKKSSREVTFNDIDIDFTNYTIEDLPIKYQECKICKVDDDGNIEEVIFTGYVNGFELKNMVREIDDKILSIELLSPMAITSNRTATAIGTFELKALINKIIEPLINDGFELVEFNVNNHNVTVNYLLETVEYCLNRLSNKFSFWWYIDENKKIYINDIDYKFNLKSKLLFDDDNNLPFLYGITPSIDATDYCNVINFTNVRVYSYSYHFTYTVPSAHTPYDIVMKKQPLFDKNVVIKKGDTVEFAHPVDIKVDNIIKSTNANKGNDILDDMALVALEVVCKDSSNNNKTLKIYVSGSSLVLSNNAEFDGEGTTDNPKDFSLIRDNFFSNLITGFKYNGNNSITTITSIKSCSALMWTRLKVSNDEEIEKCKNKINISGQVEKIIDMNETWQILPDLMTIANSYFYINSTDTDNVVLKISNDKNVSYNFNYTVGDVIEIDKENFYVKGKFIITDIKTNFNPHAKIFKEWEITLKNSNYLENYIDLFRPTETQETEEKNYNYIISSYNEDGLKEVHEVI